MEKCLDQTWEPSLCNEMRFLFSKECHCISPKGGTFHLQKLQMSKSGKNVQIFSGFFVSVAFSSNFTRSLHRPLLKRGKGRYSLKKEDLRDLLS